MSYGNTGFSVLGRITEVVTGMVWDATLKERLLAPLGLSTSVTLPEEALLHRVAVGHTSPPGAEPAVVGRWVMSRSGGPAGRICSTVADLLTFARMHLDDGRAIDGTQVLSPSSVKAMQQQQVVVPDPYTLGDAWGLGWELFHWSGRSLYRHGGNTIGQSAQLKIVPDSRLALALVCNAGSNRPLYRALFVDVLKDIAGVEMPAPLALPDTPPQLDLSCYEGSYERLNVRIDLKAAGAHLAGTLNYGGTLVAIVPKPVIEIEARPVDAKAFMFSTPELPDASPPDASPMAFYDFDASGRPKRMHAGARAMHRTQAPTTV